MNQSNEEPMSQLSVSVPAHGTHDGHGKLSGLSWLALAAGACLLAYLMYHSLTAEHAASGHGEHPGAPAGYTPPPLWACIPFAGLLISIAVLPLISATAHWWENNKNRLCVALVFAGLAILYYLFIHPMTYDHATGAKFTGAGSVVHVLEHAILAE